MTLISIETTINVDTSQFGDLAVTLAESGWATWWRIDTPYEPSRWCNFDPPYGTRDVDPSFAYYGITYEDGLGEEGHVVVTPELLAKGLALYLRTAHVEVVGELDAMEADMVLQYALFGEQVFG